MKSPHQLFVEMSELWTVSKGAYGNLADSDTVRIAPCLHRKIGCHWAQGDILFCAHVRGRGAASFLFVQSNGKTKMASMGQPRGWALLMVCTLTHPQYANLECPTLHIDCTSLGSPLLKLKSKPISPRADDFRWNRTDPDETLVIPLPPPRRIGGGSDPAHALLDLGQLCWKNWQYDPLVPIVRVQLTFCEWFSVIIPKHYIYSIPLMTQFILISSGQAETTTPNYYDENGTKVDFSKWRRKADQLTSVCVRFSGRDSYTHPTHRFCEVIAFTNRPCRPWGSPKAPTESSGDDCSACSSVEDALTRRGSGCAASSPRPAPLPFARTKPDPASFEVTHFMVGSSRPTYALDQGRTLSHSCPWLS